MSFELMQVQSCARELQRNFPNHVASFDVQSFFPVQWAQYI